MLIKLSNGTCLDPKRITYVSSLYTPATRTSNIQEFYFTYDGEKKIFMDSDGKTAKLHKEIVDLVTKRDDNLLQTSLATTN